jgi:hypothetical protein
MYVAHESCVFNLHEQGHISTFYVLVRGSAGVLLVSRPHRPVFGVQRFVLQHLLRFFSNEHAPETAKVVS